MSAVGRRPTAPPSGPDSARAATTNLSHPSGIITGMSFPAWIVFIGLTLGGCYFLARRTKRKIGLIVGVVALVAPAAFTAGFSRWLAAEVQNAQPTIDSIMGAITRTLTPTSSTTTSSVAP